jgi:hypothetical protein
VLLGQSYTLAPEGKHQYFDNDGAPCAACKLYTYAAGTSTPLASYSDNSGTPNANPVVMDSAGRATIYLSAAAYKFELKTSADVSLWTLDHIAAVPATNVSLDITGTAGDTLAAGEVVYLSDGSGSLTAGRWYLADADNTYSSSAASAVGIAPDAITSGASGSIRLQGRVTGLAGLSTGTTYYVSATAGALTSTAPSNTRIIGGADSTTSVVLAANPATAGSLSQTVRLLASTPYTLTFPAADAEGVLQSDGAGTMSFAARDLACTGRLTLTTGTPITTSDVTGAGTIYFTPYQGNQCAVYDGTNWVETTFSELSLALTLTDATNYDVFLYDNSGTPTLELSDAWTNATTRAQAISLQDGIYVKTAATTRRYLGTIRASGTDTTEDSEAKRFVWNYYHRVPRSLRVTETADTWTYTTATFRQMNGDTANQVEMVVGVAESTLVLTAQGQAYNGTTGQQFVVGIGEDSTSSALVFGDFVNTGNGQHNQIQAFLTKVVPQGYHYYAALEYSSSSGTTNWFGDNGTPTLTWNGLTGHLH